MKKRIVVCGYPKSGNTWLVRLIAEAINCPVAGFWCEPLHDEGGKEGLDRVSQYACYKAHHSHEQLQETFRHYANGSEKVVYIVRDPRDVVISASAFFGAPPRYRLLFDAFGLFPRGKSFYRRLFNSKIYVHDFMIQVVLNGSDYGAWLSTPWKKHVDEYIKSGIMIVRYEDLLSDAVSEMKRILDYIGVSKSLDEIVAAVNSQSFENKRKKLEADGDYGRLHFLRNGNKGQYISQLTVLQCKRMEQDLTEILKTFEYEVGQ
ncbi:sulfotransferase domain-containing protein [uncultured Vibrio sp.]|uniref:sulfotransferase domain-containing protein n=1 Tax=uncultured Vibrio sp. TaxID=114054 RepID=UPI002AA7477D|nr:sulfotransferase domain-containing protein [uncultured Vibrio sp.]